MDKRIGSEAPLYNSKIILSFVRLIGDQYKHVDISELLHHAGMELFQVEDESCWFTQLQVNRFFENLVTMTNNPNIAREAGRYSAKADTLSVFKAYVLAFVGPARAYQIIGRAATNFTRSCIYESKSVGRNKVEIRVTAKPGVQEMPFQCENRIGYFEVVATLFNRTLQRIEHPECMFQGGHCCRYLLTWQDPTSSFWERVRNYVFFLLTIPSFLLHFFWSSQPALIVTIVSLASVTGLMLYISRRHRRELTRTLDNLRESTEDLLEKLGTNYNNALLVNEISRALSRQVDIDGILREVTRSLEDRLDYDRGMILLVNLDGTRLNFSAGFGYMPEQLEVLKPLSFHLDKPGSAGVFVVCFRERRPFLVNDVDDIKAGLSPRSQEFLQKMGSKSFMCCPIVHGEESMGILAVDNVKTKRQLLQSDIDLLMGIVPQIGISINNAALIEAKMNQFHSILEALASTIDARDPLTAGHSTRVTEYSLGISRELDVTKEFCEMLRVASLLHDYGKIGITDVILKKRGQLTPEEYVEIKTHVIKTEVILNKIKFEGIYKDVPEVAGAHHEKFDGTGYPKGLKGSEIPLGARILAVADVFEAITAKRHYRDPMQVEKAMEILEDGKETHFDPHIVDAFIRYYMKEIKDITRASVPLPK